MPTSLKLAFFCVPYSAIYVVMTKHYDVMMEELKSWIFVTSMIIINAWQTDQNSNRENKWIEHLNQGVLEY